MSNSIRERILQAVDTALGALGGVTTGRNRLDDVTPAEMPAAIQLDGGHALGDLETGAVWKTLEVSVQGYVTGSDPAALTAAIDALYVKIAGALTAGVTLGGLAADLREVEMLEPDIIRQDQEKPFAVFSVEFEIDFETAEADVTASP